MNYWEDCIKQAFDDARINATNKQIQKVVGWVESGHEYYGTAIDNDIAHANFISDEKRELDELKKNSEEKRLWRMATQPCLFCHMTGLVAGGLGWDITCWNCDGKGRTGTINS